MTVATRSRTTAYAEAVARGEVIAGKLVKLACERHLRDLEDCSARGLFFDEEAAEWTIDFFKEMLKHWKGEWSGKALELAPWQCFIVGSIFGWKRAEDDTRRFRVAYCEIPRKNGKSTLAAGVGILLSFFDDEPGAEVYAAATKRDQAKIVWGDAKQMVLASANIRRRIRVLVNNLNDPATASKFEPLGADVDGMDGLNVHSAIIDELHAHKTRTLWDVIQTATGARRQPLIFGITTAGFGKHSVCREQHDYGERVLEGVFEDDTFFAYIASIDEGDDWRDPVSWQKANPNYGVSVKVDDLERKCAKAQQVPSEQNEFLRKHLDVWTEQETRWLDMAVWDASAGELDHEELRASLAGRDCVAGLDLSQKLDITGVELVFKDDDGGQSVLSFPFVPEENIRARVERDRVPYDVWARQGFIDATEGNVIDYEFIIQKLIDLASEFRILEVAYDPWNAMQTAIALQGHGFKVVPVRQGFQSLSEPMKEVQKLLVQGKLRHGGHPVLRWAASNVAVSMDPSGNIKPNKEKSTERIDPITALVTAEARLILQEETNDWHGIYIPEDDDE